ncbi:hypothetical protein HDF16_006144 [Granulicella aggregans]|uniref:HNH endonuclease n=1 Tax=Granulicella aggregans TaxID=474949 RepID=A0A7W7ZKI0_9BACT|nr:hypothetical protein [Granulicella aggregans]
MGRLVQRSICCPCGIEKLLARGLCATCYTLKRQDEEYFGGHREKVLARDGYRCAVPRCTTLKRGKRSLAVHHREPGNNDPKRMITLCLSCHAKVTRTLFLEEDWPELLRVLWREQHPKAKEQKFLNFKAQDGGRETLRLFSDSGEDSTALASQPDNGIS